MPSRVPPARFLSFDILLKGGRFVTFRLRLRSEKGEQVAAFSPLCECQTRLVFRVEIPGPILDVTVSVLRKTDPPAVFCLGRLVFTEQEPRALDRPYLPSGPLVDTMGQSRLHSWSGKAASVKDMVRRLMRQSKAAARLRRPAGLSRWGGWTARRVRATGFFRTHHDGRRWWLADPDGYLFWSSGLDCVHPSIDNESKLETRYLSLVGAHEALPNVLGPMGHCYRVNPWHARDDREFNYLEANCIRAFGAERWYERWTALAHGELRRLGFNTAGDWSDEHAARRAGTPYCRPLERWFRFPNVPPAGPQMPDVFHPGFPAEAAAFARCLEETRGDPCLLGYFLHNEPPWDHHPAGVAAGLLQQAGRSRTRDALVRRLRRRYGTDRALRQAWGGDASFRAIEAGHPVAVTDGAAADLRLFSTVMLGRLLTTVSRACRRADPHHLNLGVRWWTFPPLWALDAMGCFDVVSFNYYQPRVDMVGYGREREPGVERVALGLDRPFLVGEWHFGALDGGLPSAGLCRVRNQRERGKAFRVYTEQAAALPWCVGVHWFNMYDRNALYCASSNENYNIGFYDVTHRPHEPICRAARQTHGRLYDVAAGSAAPYAAPVELQFPSR